MKHRKIFSAVIIVALLSLPTLSWGEQNGGDQLGQNTGERQDPPDAEQVKQESLGQQFKKAAQNFKKDFKRDLAATGEGFKDVGKKVAEDSQETADGSKELYHDLKEGNLSEKAASHTEENLE